MKRYRLVYGFTGKQRGAARERMAQCGHWEGDWWTPTLSQIDDPEQRIQQEGYAIIAIEDKKEEEMASRVLVRTEIWAGGGHGETRNTYHLNIEVENQGDPANDINEESVVEEIGAILTRWALSWLRYEDIKVTLTQMGGGQMKK